MKNNATLTQNSGRLESLDALRGFDMCFIMGLSALITAVCSLWPGTFADSIAAQFTHAEWDGFTFYDMIFPLFLFIAGISYPFSFEKQRTLGAPKGKILLKALRRGATLILFGFVFNGIFKLDFQHFRIPSVLGRIGMAWTLAAILYIYCPRRARIALAPCFLLIYSIVCSTLTAPDAPAGAGPFSVEGNIVGYIDRMIFGKHIYDGVFDPVGLAGTLPAVVTAMLGMFTGEFLHSEKVSPSRKTLLMIGAGAALILLSLLWNLWTPINKKMWSSSYVCLAGGISLVLMSIFYYTVDVKGKRGWAWFFKVVGMNSITIYMAQKIIPFKQISGFFLNGTAALCGEAWGNIILCGGRFAVCWLFLYFLYKQKIFLKV